MSVTKKSLTFLAITFAFSWGLAFVGVVAGWNTLPVAAQSVLIGVMFGPSIAALLCANIFERGRVVEMLGLKQWRPNWWWLGGWALAVLLCLGALIFTLLLSGNSATDPASAEIDMAGRMSGPEYAQRLRETPMLNLVIILQALLLGPLINTPVLTFTEELGWRGYLHALWRPFGFWRSSLATGAIWGLWHAPYIVFYAFNYPDARFIGVPLFIVWCTLMGPIIALVRDRGRSVLAAGVLHGTMNALGSVVSLVVGAAFLWNGVVGIGGFIMLALMAVAVWLIQRPAPGQSVQQPA